MASIGRAIDIGSKSTLDNRASKDVKDVQNMG